MPRSIPIQLREHLAQEATTTCLLLRVDPVTPGYSSYGVTNLDQSITYDDGVSQLVYSAPVGFQVTAMKGNADLSVDNAETESLMPEFDIPVDEADIRAGIYDYARFRIYLVNYQDLSQGHVLLRAGTLGQIKIDADGLGLAPELRGLTAELKQSLNEKDSLSCRAIYGSQPAGSPLPGPVQLYPCGKDATAELVAFTVSSVGLENTLTFTASPFMLGDDDLNPGIVLWETGLNAGRTYEIDTNTAAGVISLSHETQFPIQIGDAGWYRPDCTKVARDAEKGCKAPHHWGDEWPLHVRAEPDIPIGDAGAIETPGASSTLSSGGPMNMPFEESE